MRKEPGDKIPLKKQKQEYSEEPKREGIKGILYMLLAVASLCLTRFFVKLCYFVSDITVWEVISGRALIVVILCSITICIKDRSLFYIPHELRRLLFLRCFIGTISFSLMFINLKFLTFSTSMIFYFLYPIFTAVVAWIFMKEKLHCFDIIALAASLLGVIFFAFPQFLGEKQIKHKQSSHSERNTPEGILMGFMQPIFMALTVIIIRKIGKRIHSLTTPAYFQLFALLVYLACLLVVGLTHGIHTHYTLELAIYIIASGVFGYIGLVAMAAALQNEKAARIASLEYVQIVFGFVFDIFLFHVDIGPSQILGSVLITFSSLMITILKCTNRIK